jgi:hypothetical protein
MAAATPATRDRYADFLRAFSILVVMAGHWLIAVIYWREGSIEGINALEVIDGLWVVTWVLQVMPLFFFVGGFSNMRSWDASVRKGEGYAGFLYGRLVRMLRPTALFLGVGLVVVTILDAANVADNAVFPASELIARPLWFLGVYMIVVALAPVMLTLHRRYGVAVVVAMGLTAMGVDLLRFGADVSAFGYVNYPVVWLLAHQLGFFYGEGGALARRRWALALGGLVGIVALVNVGPYPGSMVGLARDQFSNMDPPTIVIAVLTLWQVGLAMLLRPSISRWLEGVRVWARVIWINSVIMTVFLWHLTAMLIGIGLLYPLGFPQPEAGTAQWWLLRPLWVAALVGILGVLVVVFGRFEARSSRPLSLLAGPRVAAAAAATIAAALVVLGVLGFAMGGLHQLFSDTGTELIIFNLNPLQSVLHLALGALLLRASLRPAASLRSWSLLVAAAVTAMGIAGVVAAASATRNWLAANSADNVLHFAAAAVTVAVAIAAGWRQAST